MGTGKVGLSPDCRIAAQGPWREALPGRERDGGWPSRLWSWVEGSGPEPVPTLLSLALMHTWLCVYSLLNVCVRRRKHCRGSKGLVSGCPGGRSRSRRWGQPGDLPGQPGLPAAERAISGWGW